MSIPEPYMPDFKPRQYFCRRAQKPFTLDGRLDKPFWEEAEFTPLFVDIEGEHMAKPKYDTRAKMLWDEENLYIGAELWGDEIWAYQTERDCVIFEDNDFEIFIDPSGTSHQYIEFEMNARNTIWDLLLTKPYRDQGNPINGFDISGIKTAVYIDGELNNPAARNKFWSVEVVMPFAVLSQCHPSRGESPKLGDYWRINFSRVQWEVDIVKGEYVKRLDPSTGKPLPEFNWVYSPTGVINMHYPELWAFLHFTEKGENSAIPEIEKARWELRKLYYKQHAFYATHGCYTSDFSDISQDYTYPIKPLVEATKHNFEVSMVLPTGEELRIFADGHCGLN